MLHTRTYGGRGPLVILLHGGPGAPGHMAPVGEALAASFRVLEPFQRGSGPEPLTVARHIADLHEIVESLPAKPALAGSSWGAMLALAYAAAHPGSAAALVLIGCGTFDTTARARFQANLSDPACAYLYDATPPESGPVDLEAQRQTWNDMLRLQAEGVYPAAFSAIRVPVLMLHGAADPHPGAMIRDSLAPHLPQLEYHEFPRCGHYPWLERAARDDFFSLLGAWLTAHSPSAPSSAAGSTAASPPQTRPCE